MSKHRTAGWPQLASQEPLLIEWDTLQVGASGENAALQGSTNSAAKCSGCNKPIAFQPPIPGEPVGIWVCKTCGAVYYGDGAAAAATNAFGVVRAAQARSNPFLGRVTAAIDARISSVPPEYVQRLVSSLAGDAYSGPERRQHKRYSMSVPVVAVPLGLDFRIAGEPLRMTTKDVSLGGASLIHTRFTEAPYFALDFTVAGIEHVQVILEVLSVKNFGPVYEVAGRFINRISEKPPASTGGAPAFRTP